MGAILVFPHAGATLAELSQFIDQAHARGVPPDAPLETGRELQGQPALAFRLPNGTPGKGAAAASASQRRAGAGR